MIRFVFAIIFTILNIHFCNASFIYNNIIPGFAKNPIVAHRGAFKKNALPENSIASLQHAIALQCAGSEFDIRITEDDSLVIHHDPDYNNLPIEKTKYATLIKTPLSNGEKLPTLYEYIIAGLKNNKTTRLVCEIKPAVTSKERSITLTDKVVKLIHDVSATNMVVYISFDYEIIKRVHKIDPAAITQYLNGDKSPDDLKADGINGADYHLSVFKNKPEWIASAKKNNIILNAWTVNTPSDMDWLLANNFDFITTNEPELLAERIKISPVTKGWQLVWSDEFNYQGLPDINKWTYNEGGNGWGNNELQYYTAADSNNAIVKKGNLVITARKQTKDKNPYTSAKLVTKDKGDWLYGKLEVSAKLPAGKGMWPAIWMMPSKETYGDWPQSGEIDIMENVGFDPDTVVSSVHTKSFNHVIGTQKSKRYFLPQANSQFHLYGIEWAKDKIDFFVDNRLIFTFNNSKKGAAEWPFNKAFYLILNIAVGGNWGGLHGIDENIKEATMAVDFVRVYQKK